MNSLELLDGLINLHIASEERVAALQEGKAAIKKLEIIKDEIKCYLDKLYGIDGISQDLASDSTIHAINDLLKDK